MFHRRRHIWMATASISLILLITRPQIFGRAQPPVKSGQPDSTVFVNTIIETGFVRGANDLTIRSSFQQPMVIISIAEDLTQVGENDVILQVDDSELRNALNEASDDLSVAEDSLADSRAEAESLVQQLGAVQKLAELKVMLGESLVAAAKGESDSLKRRKTELSAQVERQLQIQNLHQDAIDDKTFADFSRMDILTIRIGSLNAETRLEELHSEIEGLSSPRIENPVIEARVQLEQLKLDVLREVDELRRRLASAGRNTERWTREKELRIESVQRAERLVDACVVRAPRAGILVHEPGSNTRAAEPMVLVAGGRILPGAELFRIPDTERFEVEGRLNEAKAIRVRAGQSVIVEPDALPGLQLTGRVASIAAEAVPGSWPNTDIREFPFVVHFEPESAEQARQKLKHGLTCVIRIDLSDE